MKKEYEQTIRVYKELGKKYVLSTYDILSAELPEFISLLRPRSNVLDVGCAGGRDSQHFCNAGHKVMGIDVVEEFLKEARRRSPKAKFVRMDLLKIDLPDNSFDAIWAHAVLLHFSKDDLPKILKSFKKILKPGGLLHVRVKRGKGTRLVKEKLIEDKERVFTFYYKKEVEQAMKDSGYKIVASRILPDELKRKNTKWVSVWGRK